LTFLVIKENFIINFILYIVDKTLNIFYYRLRKNINERNLVNIKDKRFIKKLKTIFKKSKVLRTYFNFDKKNKI